MLQLRWNAGQTFCSLAGLAVNRHHELQHVNTSIQEPTQKDQPRGAILYCQLSQVSMEQLRTETKVG